MDRTCGQCKWFSPGMWFKFTHKGQCDFPIPRVAAKHLPVWVPLADRYVYDHAKTANGCPQFEATP